MNKIPVNSVVNSVASANGMPVQPIRLNKEWVISNNRQIFLLKIDSEICGYCKSREEAEALIRSLGSSIESDLITEKSKSSKITMEIVNGDKALASKVIIYEQPLGYVYNSYPKVKHVLTWISAYKCYHNQKSVISLNHGNDSHLVSSLNHGNDSHLVSSLSKTETEKISCTESLVGAEVKPKQDVDIIEVNQAETNTQAIDVSQNQQTESQADAEDGDLSSSASEEVPPPETKFEKKARKIISRIFSFLD